MHAHRLGNLLINTLGGSRLRVSGIQLQLSQFLGLLGYLLDYVPNAAETGPWATNITISAVGVNIRHIVVGQDIAPTKSMSAASRSYIVSAVFIVTFKCH